MISAYAPGLVIISQSVTMLVILKLIHADENSIAMFPS